MKNKLLKQSLLNAFGVILYITGVALIMANAGKFFEKMPKILGTMTFLTLFVLSAAITGALILGKPIMFYLDGKKEESVKLFLWTIAWLFIFIIVIALGYFILAKI